MADHKRDHIDVSWGTWAWIALTLSVAVNAVFYVVLIVFGLFHGALMGKLAAIFTIMSAAVIFSLCHWLRPKRDA